jgi:hypothetical protein
MPKGKLFRKTNSLAIRAQDPAEEQANQRHAVLLGSFCKTMTLHVLQDKIKRQPEMWKTEMRNHLTIF